MQSMPKREAALFCSPSPQTYSEKPHHSKDGSLVQRKSIGYYSTDWYLQMFDVWRETSSKSPNDYMNAQQEPRVFEREDKEKNTAIKQVLRVLFKETKSKG